MQRGERVCKLGVDGADVLVLFEHRRDARRAAEHRECGRVHPRAGYVCLDRQPSQRARRRRLDVLVGGDASLVVSDLRVDRVEVCLDLVVAIDERLRVRSLRRDLLLQLRHVRLIRADGRGGGPRRSDHARDRDGQRAQRRDCRVNAAPPQQREHGPQLQQDPRS